MRTIKHFGWKNWLGLFTLCAIFLTSSLGVNAAAHSLTIIQKEKKSKKDKSKTGSSTSDASAADQANSTAAPQDSESAESEDANKKGKKDKKGKKGKKNKNGADSDPNTPTAPVAKGKPILWESRSDISSLNLYWGIGSREGEPKPPYTFDKEDLTGTNPKIKVIDANGTRWNMKFDDEVQSEVAASRIVWACGFMVEESYFIPSGKIGGVGKLTRARKFVAPDGSFTRAMFEKRPDTIARRNIRWTWGSNPFVGTKELSGLAILNVMLNNWDAKIDNNNVLGMYADDKSTVHDWYIQSDWGGTFGKSGGYFSHSKWDLKDFSSQRFIAGVSGGKVNLHYTGKMENSLKTIPIEHAKWFAEIVNKLSDEQIRDAFRAAGASDAETTGFVTRLRQKINELKASVNQ